MSAPLLVLTPLALLLLVILLCFVGCQKFLGLDDKKFDDVADYPNRCAGVPELVAYWPLNQPALSTQVKNLKDVNTHPGDVVNVTTAPAGRFPCPPFSSATTKSAAAPGELTLGQTGIVAGDTVGGVVGAPLNPCMHVDGGYVRVKYDAAINPAAFTIEAWVLLDKNAELGDFRCVVDSRDVDASGNGFGFALVLNTDNKWEAWLGIGPTAPHFVKATSASALTPGMMGMTYYLAATFDGMTTLTLYAEEVPPSTQTLPGGATYHPNAKQDLFIGAGGAFLPLRPQPPNVMPPTGPLFPFKGKIQDVGLYSRALTDKEIALRVMNGNGCDLQP
jgi:hypothetical protein